MLKKRCFAALSGILLAISVIAPFSFVDTYAYQTGMFYPKFSYIISADEQWSQTVTVDFYFYSYFPVSTDEKNHMNDYNYHPWCRLNTQFIVTPLPLANWSFALIEGDGVVTFNSSNQTSGNSSWQRFMFILEDCTYFHFQVKIRSSYWTSSTITNAGSVLQMESTSNSSNLIQNTKYTNNGNDLLYKILNTLQNTGITIDTSGIEDILDDIYQCNLESNSNEEEIIDKMNSIIELLQVQPGSSTEDVIDNNDQLISDANDVVSDYDTLTSTFDSNFQDSQEEMTTILQNTSLTQFTDAAIWFTTQLGLLYQSLGDMQILVALPLILGIALFFIGRGNVIFREPNNQTWNETYIHDTYADGSESFTKRSTISYTKRKRSSKDPNYF